MKFIIMTKGKLWWKKEWYSICSRHQEYDKYCSICQCGTWENVWKLEISKIYFRIRWGKI